MTLKNILAASTTGTLILNGQDTGIKGAFVFVTVKYFKKDEHGKIIAEDIFGRQQPKEFTLDSKDMIQSIRVDVMESESEIDHDIPFRDLENEGTIRD